MNCFLVMGAQRAWPTLGVLNRIEDRREEKWMAAFKYLTQRHQARPHLKVSQPPKAESPPWEQVFKYGLRGPFHIQEVRPRVYLPTTYTHGHFHAHPAAWKGQETRFRAGHTGVSLGGIVRLCSNTNDDMGDLPCSLVCQVSLEAHAFC